MLELLTEAIAFGWPFLALVVGISLYKQTKVKDPEVKKNMTFNTMIGLIASVMLLIAIVNYRDNFGVDDGKLPISLVMITSLTFLMGIYFSNISALMKIGGFMFFVAAALSGYGNWLPQVEGGFPPPEVKLDFQSMSAQQLGDEGEKIIFGGLGQSKVQGAIGKGQCPLCHGFNQGFLSERAPNLWDIPARAEERLKHEKYHMNDPAARDTVQKEAFEGSGTATTGQEYIAESHACPNCFVVPGFGVKGSNDTESPMPRIHKPPISLTIGEMAAVDTWMYVREGKDPPTYDEIQASYEKFIPEADRPKASAGGDEAAGGVLATGEEPITDLFMKAGCPACHTIPGIEGATGKVGPLLMEGSNAVKRMKDPGYQGRAKSAREYITESILKPSAYVVKDYPDNQMPKDFGVKLSAGAVNKIVDYLSRLEEGKEPPALDEFN
ncbi:nitric oxide reductase [Candidatus Nitronereus thalassa]|uniref:Nitric oxide reductase n=1 Tax=Candidatus Nitronereus thalassa TaxID=3020898 RepID=A0ABU3KCB9_9BACT|nr:nitric oxide reductase [Candidatus Nitronereus thalassa]MDT7044170.1 nitric oxide reductase [Candidatus Nitronereus thalassa]